MHAFSVRAKPTSWRTQATKISFTMSSPIIRAVIPVIIRTVANGPRPGMVRTKPSSRERSPTTTKAKNRETEVRKSEVRGQKSEVGGRRSEVRGRSISHAENPAVKDEAGGGEGGAADDDGCGFEA